jgi:hypothetical protein
VGINQRNIAIFALIIDRSAIFWNIFGVSRLSPSVLLTRYLKQNNGNGSEVQVSKWQTPENKAR